MVDMINELLIDNRKSFFGTMPTLDKVLRCYPKMDDAELLSFGFKYGFQLHYEGSRRLIETKNLKSVMQNPLAAKEKIENEMQNGRIAGPFSKRPIWNLRCSPVGIDPSLDNTAQLYLTPRWILV
jgi:hypothetical protein